MVKTQFIEIENEKFVRSFDVNDAVDDPEKYQPPRYIRIEKPLRNSAITYYDPVSHTPVEDATLAASVKKQDFKKLRAKRNELLAKTDWTQNQDASLSDDVLAKYQSYRQKLRDITETDHPYYVKWPVPLVDGVEYTDENNIEIWVTDENGPLLTGDGLVASSNVAGYFTKGEPAVVTINDACDFSESTTETYYSNIVSVTRSNVVTTSNTAQSGFVENAYWTSNTVSHYTGNIVSHYSNVVVYDGVGVYANVDVATYSNLPADAQSLYAPVEVTETSFEERNGFTPVWRYSNVSADQYAANVHTGYTKIVTHYSNISVVETVEYSNISAAQYEALDAAKVITPGYTSFVNDTSNTTIRVREYAQLTPERRAEYAIVVTEPVTSNLQSHYTPQTKVTTREIRNLDANKAARVVCSLAM